MDWALNAAQERPVNCLVELAAKPLEVETKKDGSSVTNADYASHKIIGSDLAASGWPVISEEGVRTSAQRTPILGTVLAGRPPRRHQLLHPDAPGYASQHCPAWNHDGKEWVPFSASSPCPTCTRVYFRRATAWAYSRTTSGSNKPPAKPIRADEDASPPYELLISWNESGTAQ